MKKVTLVAGLLALLVSQVVLINTAFAGTIQFLPGGNTSGGNRAPYFTAPVASSFTVQVSNMLQFSVTATDPDGDSLLYSASSMPAGAMLSSGVFSWTPSVSQVGQFVVVFRVSDGQITVDKNVTIDVTNTPPGGGSNLVPVFNSPSFSSMSVNIGQTAAFSVLANDPENQPLTYSMINGPSGASFSGQQFSWTPNSNQAGLYNFAFRVTDGVNTVDKPMTISVNNPNGNPYPPYNPYPNPCYYNNCYPYFNSAPVITSPNASSYTVGAGQQIDLYVAATDADGDGLTYQAMNIPIGASFSDRTFSWRPTNTQTGSYNVTFRASDSKTYTDKTVTIYASTASYPYNNAPVFVSPSASSFTVNIGSTLEFTVTATDADSEPLVYSIVNAPVGASFTSQFFSWRPASNQVGTYTVTLRVSDNKTTTEKVITISSGIAPNAPRFIGFNAPSIVREGQLYLYTATAMSQNGGTIKYRVITGPQGLVINPTFGTILWVPGYNQARTEPYLVTVGASDGVAEGAQSFYITVLDAPAPVGGPIVIVPPTRTTSSNLVGTPVVKENPLQISNVRVESKDNGDVVVRFDTSKPTRGRVIYDTASQAEKTSDFSYANATLENSNLSTSNEITITDLKENTGYYLRAVGKTEDGETAFSSERVIVRLPDNSVQDLTLASVLGSVGSLINQNPLSIVAIIGLGIVGTMVYMRRKNTF